MAKRSVLGATLFVGSEVEGDLVGPVQLLESPIVEIDSDIFAFILKHWFVTLFVPSATRLTDI